MSDASHRKPRFPVTLAALLSDKVSRHPDWPVIRFLKDGETLADTITFRDLWQKSNGIARQLRERFCRGDRIGISQEFPHEFLASFLACQVGGFVAVPLPATGGRKDQLVARSLAFLRDAEAVAVLVDARGQARLGPLGDYPGIVIDDVSDSSAGDAAVLDTDTDDLAYLQYTSGSTGSPKGVCITNRNVLANLRQITQRLRLPEGMPMVSWLPNHHDQGLVGSLLLPVFLAGTCYAMKPTSFVQQPLRWLRAISRYRAYLSGGPNFAFDYCVRAAEQATQPLDLDLSCWRVAFNGAERVFHSSLVEFSNCFAAHGFRRSAWAPCYGMAEATLAISLPPLREENSIEAPITVERDGIVHVACGQAMDGTDIAVVGVDTGEMLSAGELGEIWVRGPSVSARYWKHEATIGTPVSGAHDTAGPPLPSYLRTGDFGFVESGNVFIVGRREDRFIIRGRNHFAIDVEKACRIVDHAIADCAVFTSAVDALPRLAVEIRRTAAGKVNLVDLTDSIAQAIHDKFDLLLAAVHYVRQGSLPRTTSGKIRRSECARLTMSSQLSSLGTHMRRPDRPSSWEPVAEPLMRNLRALLRSLQLEQVADQHEDSVLRLDSIDQVRVQHLLETTFGFRASLLGRRTTLRSIGNAIQAAGAVPALDGFVTGAAHGRLCELQHDLLLADRICASTLYTVGCLVRIEALIDLSVFADAFAQLARRHPILMSAVASEPDGEYSLVPAGAAATVENLSARTGDEQLLEEWFAKPFVVGLGPLLRVAVQHLNKSTLVLVAAHHLVVDHWSMRCIADELATLCRARFGPMPTALPYSVFAARYAETLETRRAELKTFWSGKLRDVADPPLLHRAVRQPVREWGCCYVLRELAPDAIESIKDCASKTDAGLSAVVLSVFGLLIMRYSATHRTVVSCAVSLRDDSALRSTIGYMVNSVPVVIDASGVADFATLCRAVRAELDLAKAHAAYPQHLIAREFPAQEEADSVSPLARYVFNFLDERQSDQLDTPGEEPGYRIYPRASHPLAELQLTVRLQPQGLRIEISGLAARYQRALLEEFAEGLIHLLEQVTAIAHSAVDDVDILSAGQRARLQSYDGAELPLDRRRLEEWIHATALQYPDRVALSAVRDDESWEHLSYAALRERSVALAGTLRIRGAPVAVVMECSIDQIVAIVAILGAGGIYLPIDPQLPTARIAAMIADSGCRCVLTDANHIKRLRASGISASLSLAEHGGEYAPLQAASDAEPAALIYTSGSSGRPKGVMLTHSAYVARMRAMQEELGIRPEDVFIQKTSVSFDVSVWEIFLPLVSGARLVLPPRSALYDPQSLTQILERGAVTTVHFVPTMLREWLASLQTPGMLRSLRRCLCSGEVLRGEHRDAFLRLLPDTQLVNLYGPTECGIDVTWSTELHGLGDPPIGKPTANVRVRILKDQQLLPPGIPGQLCIAGPQLALGYWGQPGLTAERFVPAMDARPGERIYLSGDYAAWRPDGQLCYGGRMDRQVKVRGVRIELDEIRTAVCTHPDVEGAEILILDQPTGPVIGAAILSSHEITAMQVQEHLMKLLPGSAVPTLIRVLPAFPVLANGKCDQKQLRTLLLEPTEATRGAAASTGPTWAVADRVAQAWEAVLGTYPKPGARFFAVGGDSIKAIRLVNELRKRSAAATVADIYRFQSIEEQSREFARATSPESAADMYRNFSLLSDAARQCIELREFEDVYPLSMLQRTIVMHSFGESRYETYVSGIRLRGAFVATALHAALERLLSDHPFLRSSFDLTSTSEPLQLVHKQAAPAVTIHDLTTLDQVSAQQELDQWRQRELQNPFRWDQAPLLRVGVHLLADGQFVVHVTEAALDGWCVALVLKDLIVAYDRLVGGMPMEAQPESPSYGYFVALERAATASGEIRGFWREKVRTMIPQQILRWSSSRPSPRKHRRMEISLRPQVATQLRSSALARGLSVKHVYLALYTVMLGVLRGRSTVLAMIECNGRPECEGGDRTVGVFNNMLPAEVCLNGKTWAALARELSELEAQLQPYRRFPIAEILKELGGRSLGDALFVYTDFHVLNALRQLGNTEVLDVWASDETYVPLTFHVNSSSWHGVRILLDYDESEFCPAQMAWLAGWLSDCAAVLSPAMDRQCLPEGSMSERMLRSHWDYVGGTVAARVFRQAHECSTRIALVEGARSISYQTLRQHALYYANQFLKLGVRPTESIALVAPSGIDVACAMLGAWAAGICCVPIDPEQPRRRVDSMIRSSGAKLVLLHAESWDLIDADSPVRKRLFGIDSAPSAAMVEPDMAAVHPQQPAYILYTSGSSGSPKPVAVSQASLSNYIRNSIELYGLSREDRVWNHSSIGFDFTLTTLIAPLCAGSTVICVHKHDLESIMRGALREDVVKFTPTHLHMLRRHPDFGQASLPSRIIVGGELLYTEDAEALKNLDPGLRIFNEYGPTEACVGCSVQEYDGGDFPVVAIGSAIGGMQLHLLDDNLVPVVADAVAGEIYISGVGLAIGYIGHPDVTAASFVPCPFGPPGAVMYRTGDAGRYTEGRLVCTGRNDRQVKVRAHRVELGEVENCMMTCREIARAVVDHRDGQLVAWIVPQNPVNGLRQHLIRLHIETNLPEYMRPARIYELASIPLTAHGKIDYSALTEQGRALLLADTDLREWVSGLSDEEAGQVLQQTLVNQAQAGESNLSPIKQGLLSLLGRARPLETGEQPSAAAAGPAAQSLLQTLSAIWAEVLDRPTISSTDNYFRLGGDSISSILITAKARKAGIPVTTRMLLENPTLAELVEKLLEIGSLAAPACVLAAQESSVEFPLTPMQAGILHDALRSPEQALYESHLTLRIEGELDLELLSLAWSHVLHSNEALQTRFTADATGMPMQVADREAQCDLIQVDCSSAPARGPEVLSELKRTLAARCREPGRAPLCAIAGLRLGPELHQLLFVHHHLILDGWSQQLVLEQLFMVYTAFCQGSEPEDVQRPSFRQFVEVSRSTPYAVGFWQDYLRGYVSKPQLTVRSDDPITTTTIIPIPPAAARAIGRLAAECGVTFALLLQGLWVLVLGAVSGVKDTVYGLTVSGRDTSYTDQRDFSSLVGMCINTLPVRPPLPDGLSLEQWLQELQRGVWGVLAHQYNALSDIVRDVGGGRAPLFETLVVVENLPILQATDGLRIRVEGFEIKEGLPIVLVLFLGAEPRIELRLRPACCKHGMADRLSRALSQLLQAMGSTTLATRVDSLLESLTVQPPATRLMSLGSSRRTRM